MIFLVSILWWKLFFCENNYYYDGTTLNYENKEKAEETEYFADVNYQGEEVPYYLFESEFQKSEYGYTPNVALDISDELYASYEEALDA